VVGCADRERHELLAAPRHAGQEDAIKRSGKRFSSGRTFGALVSLAMVAGLLAAPSGALAAVSVTKA
jgi:hypothetical protein